MSDDFLPPELELINAQFFDAEFQCGMRQAEVLGGAVWTGNPTLRGVQRGFDGLALARIELPAEFLWRLGAGADKGLRINAQPAVLRKNHGTFDDVLHFPHVARPGIPDQRVHDFRWNAFDSSADALRELLGEMTNQQRNVVATLAQRRQQDREHVQAIEKVAAKLAVGDHLRQVSIRCRHQPHIHTHRARASQAFEFLLLESSEQLRLEFERNVTDFVEEQRAAIGQLEAADSLRDRPGEGALLVTEQFAFEQPGRNRGAVEFDESPVAPRA